MIPTLFQIGLGILTFLAGTQYEKWMAKVRVRQEMPYKFVCQYPGCFFNISGNLKDGVAMVAEEHMRTIHAEL